jgi:hypothetical protein
MHSLDVYIDNPDLPTAKIRPLSVKRDWMHAQTYNCHPIALANTFGYGIYFDNDISFMWDGLRGDGAVGIIGKENIWVGRGEGTVSFITNLIFKSDENTSLLTMPVPNEQIEGTQVLSTILSTSIFTGTFSIVLKLDTPNKEYFVPAGTNVACILPISVGSIQDSTINIHSEIAPFERVQDSKEYITYLKDLNLKGIRPKMYKKAINHKGESLGKHEVDNIKLNVVYDDGAKE